VVEGDRDLIGIVESFYTAGLSEDDWLRVVMEKVRPLIDRYRLGVSGVLYNCPDPCTFVPSHVLLCDVSEGLQALLFEGMKDFSPAYIADTFLNRACYLGSTVRGWDEISTIRNGRAHAGGLYDGLQLNAIEPDGAGCWFGSPQSEIAPLSDELYLTLLRVARHLAAAHRLRRKHAQARVSPEEAEAVLGDDGRIEQAEGMAKEPASRAALARAAKTMEKVRSRRTRSEPRDAIKEWQSMVWRRWSLVEHFEEDGKRFVLAMDNRAKPPSIQLLSERERDVAFRALRGESNKAIAHALGLAHSTIRVLLARAAAKVGARSRAELLEMLAARSSVAEASEPAPDSTP
jgi:DNA-binding CsgD family transcriptional regulator